jgi:hypothetical protein
MEEDREESRLGPVLGHMVAGGVRDWPAKVRQRERGCARGEREEGEGGGCFGKKISQNSKFSPF